MLMYISMRPSPSEQLDPPTPSTLWLAMHAVRVVLAVGSWCLLSRCPHVVLVHHASGYLMIPCGHSDNSEIRRVTSHRPCELRSHGGTVVGSHLPYSLLSLSPHGIMRYSMCCPPLVAAPATTASVGCQ